MKRILFLSLLILCLAACTPETIIKTEYVEKKVPVNSVPHPPAVEKPVLETTKLTKEDRKDIGKVSQALVTENKQQAGYIKILELIINKYNELADKSEVKSVLTVPGLNDQDEDAKE